MRRYIILALLLISCLLTDFGTVAEAKKKQVTDTIGLKCRGVVESFPKIGDGIVERLDFYVEE